MKSLKSKSKMIGGVLFATTLFSTYQYNLFLNDFTDLAMSDLATTVAAIGMSAECSGNNTTNNEAGSTRATMQNSKKMQFTCMQNWSSPASAPSMAMKTEGLKKNLKKQLDSFPYLPFHDRERAVNNALANFDAFDASKSALGGALLMGNLHGWQNEAFDNDSTKELDSIQVENETLKSKLVTILQEKHQTNVQFIQDHFIIAGVFKAIKGHSITATTSVEVTAPKVLDRYWQIKNAVEVRLVRNLNPKIVDNKEYLALLQKSSKWGASEWEKIKMQEIK